MGIFNNDIKIDTDLSNNFFNIYNEARGIAKYKKKILDIGMNVSISYINKMFINFIVIFILCIIILLQHYSMFLVNYAYIIIILDMAFFLVSFLRILLNYIYRKKDKFISTVLLNKRGIVDMSSFKDTEILFKWNRVEGIVVGYYSVVILLDGNIYLYFNKKDKKKIIEGVKKFKKNILVIE